MNKENNAALRRAIRNRHSGRYRVDVNRRRYADGTVSYDASLAGRGEHDYDDEMPLASLAARDWPSDGALWVVVLATVPDEMLACYYARFAGGNFVGLRGIGS